MNCAYSLLLFILYYFNSDDIFQPDFTSRSNSKSTMNNGKNSLKNVPPKIEIFERSRKIIELLKEKLVNCKIAELTDDDSFDYVTSWQIVSMITLSSFVQILKNYLFSHSEFDVDNENDINDDNNVYYDKHNNYSSNNYSSYDDRNRNRNRNESEYYDDIIDRRTDNNSSLQSNKKSRGKQNKSKSSTFILKTLSSFYELLQCVLEVLNVRVRYTNSKKLSDYLISISSLVLLSSNLCIESAISRELNTKSRDAKDICKMKETCSILFLFVAKIVRDLGTLGALHFK